MKHQTKGWPPERRRKQAETMRKTRPWTKTKGPKTAAGKRKSAANALKTGLHAADIRRLRRLLKLHRQFLKGIRRACA